MKKQASKQKDEEATPFRQQASKGPFDPLGCWLQQGESQATPKPGLIWSLLAHPAILAHSG